MYSIIVPIYKVESYLKECIQSVINQEFQDWELILVDDGSPDKCPYICDEFVAKDSRIKVVHKQNGGLVSARKAGLKIASGEYAICLDGDDFLDKQCLLKIEDQVQLYHPDVLCYGYIKAYTNRCVEVPFNKSYRIGYYDREAMEKEIFPRLLYTSDGLFFPRVVWAKAYKMDLYRKYQMNVSPEISMGEDGACTYPLICNANSMVVMSECLHYYRQIETSMTKVKKPLKWDNYDKVYSTYENCLPLEKYGLKDQICRSRTHNLFNISMSQFYSGCNFKKSVSLIENQFKENPVYDEYIDNAKYSSVKMKICRFVLKYRLYLLLFVYSRCK